MPGDRTDDALARLADELLGERLPGSKRVEIKGRKIIVDETELGDANITVEQLREWVKK